MNRLSPALALLATVVATSATAEDSRSPADLTEADRARMVQSSQAYSACLQQEGQRHAPEHEDPRRVADVAMDACRSTLDALGSLLTELNLAPEFRESFLRTTRDRAARNALAGIMEAKATAR